MINRLLNKFRLVICLFVINLLSPFRLYRLKRLLLIGCGVKCGKDVKVSGKLFLLSNNLIIGNNVWLGDNLKIYNSFPSQVIIESNIDIAPNCTICTGTHDLGTHKQRAGKGILKDIKIGEGTWIGINSVIIAGVKVGKGNIAAAGSVIINNTDDDLLVGGVPARPLRRLNGN